jgi:hypothetical protein
MLDSSPDAQSQRKVVAPWGRLEALGIEEFNDRFAAGMNKGAQGKHKRPLRPEVARFS